MPSSSSKLIDMSTLSLCAGRLSCSVLIFGAQDTTSSALSRVLHLLSLPEHFVLQNRLREEILHACENHFDNDLKYEDLNSLPVLDAVLKETLRLYVQLLLNIQIDPSKISYIAGTRRFHLFEECKTLSSKLT